MPDADDLVLVRRDDLRELLLDAVILEKRTTHEQRQALWAAVNGEAATVETFYEANDGEQFPTPEEAATHCRLPAEIFDKPPQYRRVVVHEKWVVGPWTTQETP